MSSTAKDNSQSHAKTLHLRVFGGIAVKIATAVLQFIAIPVIISQAGLETYGLFGIFSIIIIYFAMADLGITKSTLRFVSMSKPEEVTDIFSVIFILTSVFSLCVVGMGVLLSDPVLRLLEMEISEYNLMLFDLALVTSLLFVARSLYVSVLYALENFQFAYSTTVAFDMVRWGASIGAVTIFGDPLQALLVVAVVSTLLHVIALAYVVHITNGIRIVIPKNANVVKAILRYSFSVFTIDMLNKMSSYADKILVASTSAVTNFAQYYIAFQVIGKISDFLSAVTIPYIQSVAKHFGRGDMSAIRFSINAAFDKVGLVFLPAILSLIVFGNTYLSIWLDPLTAGEVYPFVAVLSAGYTMSIFGTISISFANVVGRTSISVLSSTLMAGTILVGGLLVLPTYGPFGMAIVWSAAQAIPLLFVFPLTMGALGVGRSRLVFRSLITIVTITLAFMGASLLAKAIFGDPAPYEMLMFALGALALSFLPTVIPLMRSRV